LATASASATVTLLPVGSDDGGALPDTGGSNLSLILLGGGLVLVGGGVTYMARRRQSSH
jgi:LPXTG-motif cell wall-anchored protein